MNTLQELLREVPVEGRPDYRYAKGRKSEVPKVVDGLKPKSAPREEGLHVFTPEELLTVYVDEVQVPNGKIKGYQREFDPLHARKAAEYLRAGGELPVLEFGLDGRGRIFADDGQHRAAAGIIARIPVRAVVTRRDAEQRMRLFTSQRNAKKIDPNILILSSDGPSESYIKEAIITTDAKHPWFQFVSPTRNSKTKIGPYALWQLMVRYVANRDGHSVGARTGFNQNWDRGFADELAPLVRCFGNKKTNPLAFRPCALNAIGSTAMQVFRRRLAAPEDQERWMRHMPTFQFGLWPHLRSERDLREQLILHWNKGLRGKRRITWETR